MRRLWPILGLVVLTVFLTRFFFPRQLPAPPPIPTIVTVHDTVHDTLRVRGPKVVTTDTIQLVIRQTIHDTVSINAGCEPAERTNVWPVLSAEVGEKAGDTTRLNTFSLRTGQGASLAVYTAGPLLGIWADSVPSPRVMFGEWPKPQRTSVWTKALWGGVGYGACSVVNGLANLLRPQ